MRKVFIVECCCKYLSSLIASKNESKEGGKELITKSRHCSPVLLLDIREV